ncbi:hypothetical protein GYA19_03840 [Candidatus Beckwithbacteria bacterium]|nr:hypothetical protein [Candidatus Beckwithbacteria bacterium]
MLLAVDGGATKTHILVADEQGKFLAEAKSGPLSFMVVSKEESLKNLNFALSLVKNTLNQNLFFSQILIGLASMDTVKEKDVASEFFMQNLKLLSNNVRVVNDTLIALEGGTDKQDAILLIAGTGSNCYGRNSDGEEAKAGGLDYLLTDEGSAFYLGMNALRKVIQAEDGRGDETILTDLIINHFGIREMSEIKDFVYGANFSKTDIAKLSMIVSEAAYQGDDVALTLLEKACHELVRLVLAVGDRLDFREKEFDLVLVGSLFKNKVLDLADFEFQIKEKFPKANIVVPTQSPVYGALKMMVK